MDSGLPSAVKYAIAKDINEKNATHLNIYDLVSRYCADIQAVTGSTDAPMVLAVDPVCDRCNKTGHNTEFCFAKYHKDSSLLDPKTKTAKATKLFKSKYGNGNFRSHNQGNDSTTLDVSKLNDSQREQLMANLTMAELENKGKITNYLLYYLLSKLSKSKLFAHFADSTFMQQLFLNEELFSDAHRFLTTLFSNENKPVSSEKVTHLFSSKSDAFAAQCCRIILDSGAGLHLSPTVTATNFDNQIMVSGFNGSTSPTRGSGALPCVFEDARSGGDFTVTLDNVNKFDGDRTLISFGLLIKNGFTFEARNKEDLWLHTPCKRHTIRATIGEDNIMYLPCKTNRTCNYANKHNMKQASFRLFHLRNGID